MCEPTALTQGGLLCSSTQSTQHSPYRMLPMEADRELAGELPGDSDRSRGEMRFSCPLAARCTSDNVTVRLQSHLSCRR